MTTKYNVYVENAWGTPISDGSLNDFITLEYGKSEMEVGKLDITLPYRDHLAEKFSFHNRIYVWNEGILEGGAFWLVDRVNIETDERGGNTWHVGASCPNAILTYRHALDYANTPRTDKIGEAAQVMRDIMVEAFGTEALGGLLATNQARDISAHLDIPPVGFSSPIVYKAFAYQQIYSTLVYLAESSIERGTYLTFDTVLGESGKLEFRIYRDQRGIDRRDTLVLSVDTENLSGAQYEEDYADVATAVLVAGKGEELLRETVYVVDQARITQSPFGYIEAFRDQRNIDDIDRLTTEANARLNEGRGRVSMRADIQERPDATFGVHFGFGDFVTARIGDKLFEGRLKGYVISVSEGTRKVAVRFEGTPRAQRRVSQSSYALAPVEGFEVPI